MNKVSKLPRPQSRFRRPQDSWTRRLLAAGGLRFSFLLVWLVVLLLAWAPLRYTAREYGYLYGLPERLGLWQQVPDARAMDALQAIYAGDPDLPEMVILRHLGNPQRNEPAYEALLNDPFWGKECRRLSEPPPKQLAFNGRWTQEAFEKYIVQEAVRGLSAGQLTSLEAFRSSQIKGVLSTHIADADQARALSQRVRDWFNRPPMISSNRRQFLVGAAGTQIFHDFREIEGSQDLQHQLALFRRIQVLKQIDPDAGQGPLTRDMAGKLRANVQAGRDLDRSLLLLSHIQKLDPWCKKYDLEMKLTPAQRKVLESDPWL